MRLFKPAILGFLSFLIPLSLSAQAQALYDIMAQDNLRTSMHNSLEDKNSLNELIKKNNKFHQILTTTLHQQQNLSSAEKRRLAFMLLSDYEKQHQTPQTTVLDTTSWQDLEMLSGPKSNLSHYLASKIDLTATVVGQIVFFRKLIQPSSDLNYLKNNQAIIKELVHNENLFLDIQHHIERLKKTESIILSLWEEDIYENILKQSTLSIPHAPQSSEWVDRNTTIVELVNMGRLGSLTGINLGKAIAAIALPAQGISWLSNSSYYDSIKEFNNNLGLKAVSIMTISGYILSRFEKKHPTNQKIETLSNVVSGPMAGVDVLYFEDQLRNEAAFKKGLQAKLMATAQYIDSLKQLSRITKENPILLQRFPEITSIVSDLKKLSEKSSEVKQLLNLLETSTFKGKTSIFSFYGRMYVAYKLLTKVKQELIPFMITAGKLDAYLSSAKLIIKFKKENIDFCFPNYIINSSKPFVKAELFWNPAIDFRKVVPSSLTLGHENKQNVIVTGPNAGGKSTVVKGLIINIIMAQSLGIAAAKSFTLTPFENIITYLNITDDIAAGNSHFKAGVFRAQKLLETAAKQTDNNFSFTAVDELFDGTTFKEAQAAAYSLIEQLGKYNNNICVTVTHFPKVTLLEKRTKNFTNYRVTVQKDASGRISYPYKLEKGISNQSIALDILKQEGFSATFLNKAQEILNES